MSILEALRVFLNNETLKVFEKAQGKPELWLLKILAPLLHASMRHEEADAMLCSENVEWAGPHCLQILSTVIRLNPK